MHPSSSSFSIGISNGNAIHLRGVCRKFITDHSCCFKGISIMFCISSQAIGKESTPIPLDGARDEVVHGSGHEQQLSVLKPKTDRDLYLDDICKMYPDINMSKLSEHMSYYENWASVRMDAALKAYGKVNDMLMNGKLTYYRDYMDPGVEA